jgi:hypothetical protein
VVAGAAALLVTVGFFAVIAHRDGRTLAAGERTTGQVVGFVQPEGWDPFDSGRLVVRYSLRGATETRRIWIDNELSDYTVGQRLELYVRGGHVRTAREPNDPAPWGLAAIVLGLCGIASIVRGVTLGRRRAAGREVGGWARWRAWDQRTADRMWSGLWWAGVPLFVLFVTPFVLMDIGPAYAARHGGTPGTFVVRHEDCGGRGGCSYYGDFRSDDGRVARHDVLMASGGDVHAVGDESRAVDTGDRAVVYPPGGGQDWLFTTAFLVGLVVVGTAWCVALFRRVVAARGRWR